MSVMDLLPNTTIFFLPKLIKWNHQQVWGVSDHSREATEANLEHSLTSDGAFGKNITQKYYTIHFLLK